MKIAVASGKGGTGKTTIATNLAWVAAERGIDVTYVDCDVEEPNGHLFLKPEIQESFAFKRLYPEVDRERCNHCGLCGQICQYSAIVCVADKVLVYPELCHSCGGCALVCKAGAIREVKREAGRIETGRSGRIGFVNGLLRVGEAMSTPLIRQVKEAAPESELVVLDSPPGTSCPVVESVRGTDFVLLVTEPTPFGLNDLKLAVKMVHALRLPLGVVINRARQTPGETHAYCRQEGVQILAEFPDDRRVAEAYSRGLLAAEFLPELRAKFGDLLNDLVRNAGGIVVRGA